MARARLNKKDRDFLKVMESDGFFLSSQDNSEIRFDRHASRISIVVNTEVRR